MDDVGIKMFLNFMASQGSQNFNTMELLGMEEIHDKLIKIGVAQNNVTLGASLSLVRGIYLISMTHYGVLSLIFKILNLILYFKKLNSHLCSFLLSIVFFICFFYLFLS